MSVRELDFEEALAFVAQHGTKLVWLGSEPADYITTLLGIDHTLMREVDPNSVLHSSKEEAQKYKNSVFVCYHGITSHHVAKMLMEKHGVDSVNLKGGVTAILGEIF